MRLNILHLISGRGVNGALTYCKFLCEELLRSGHNVSVLCRSDCWQGGHLVDGANVVLSEMDRTLFELKRITKWVRDNRIELLHTHMSRAHAFGVLLSRTSGVPVVATAHSRSFQLHWTFNDFVIANSQATHNYHRRINRVAKKKIETVHCFTDLDRFRAVTPARVDRVRQQMQLTGDEFVVGMVGHVVARKGQLYLFRALPEIMTAIPNLKLVLLGPFDRNSGYVKRLRRLQLRHRLGSRVQWLGTHTNVPDFMSAFDLSVVPSLEEPLGLVAVESLAAGTPVVAARTGGLPEIIQPHVNGLLVPPRNPKKLAEAIITLATDAQQRVRLGALGQEMVFQAFDPKKLARRVEEIYQEVLARRRVA